MANYYIDVKNGDDAQGGTSWSDAWKSLSKLNNLPNTQGHTVYIAEGTYDEVLNLSSVSSYWVKVIGVGKVVIQTSNPYTFPLRLSSNYWHFENIEFSNIYTRYHMIYTAGYACQFKRCRFLKNHIVSNYCAMFYSDSGENKLITECIFANNVLSNRHAGYAALIMSEGGQNAYLTLTNNIFYNNKILTNTSSSAVVVASMSTNRFDRFLAQNNIYMNNYTHSKPSTYGVRIMRLPRSVGVTSSTACYYGINNEFYYSNIPEVNTNEIITTGWSNSTDENDSNSHPGFNYIYEDPKFTDPVNGDFTFQEDSPCLKWGFNNEKPGARVTYSTHHSFKYTQGTYDGTEKNPHRYAGAYQVGQVLDSFNSWTLTGCGLGDDGSIELSDGQSSGTAESPSIDLGYHKLRNIHIFADTDTTPASGNRQVYDTDNTNTTLGIIEYKIAQTEADLSSASWVKMSAGDVDDDMSNSGTWVKLRITLRSNGV